MAYTFFKAMNRPVGRSLVEDDKLDSARDIMTRAQQRNLPLLLPTDHVVAPKLEAGAPSEVLLVDDAAIGDRMGLDIGPKTIAAYADALKAAHTVVWNGPMGVFEIDAFAEGTIGVAQAVAAVKGTTIIGGGDSIAAVKKAGVADRITHISTGGGRLARMARRPHAARRGRPAGRLTHATRTRRTPDAHAASLPATGRCTRRWPTP